MPKLSEEMSAWVVNYDKTPLEKQYGMLLREWIPRIVVLEQNQAEKSDLPICCLCGKRMLPNVKYQVFGFVSNPLYTHIKCDHPPEKTISMFVPWMWNEINGEKVE